MPIPLSKVPCFVTDMILEHLEKDDADNFTGFLRRSYNCPDPESTCYLLHKCKLVQEDLSRTRLPSHVNKVVEYRFYEGDGSVHRTIIVPKYVKSPGDCTKVTCRFDILDVETIGLKMHWLQPWDQLDLDWLCSTVDARMFFADAKINIPRGVYANPVELGGYPYRKLKIKESETNFFRFMGLNFLDEFRMGESAVDFLHCTDLQTEGLDTLSGRL